MENDKQKIEFITAEDAVFEIEAVSGQTDMVVNAIKLLGERLRRTLPSSQGKDIGRQLDELAERMAAVVDGAVASIREQLMDWGVPGDDSECGRCGSPTFSGPDCEACNAIASDGLRLARRLGGWMV